MRWSGFVGRVWIALAVAFGVHPVAALPDRSAYSFEGGIQGWRTEGAIQALAHDEGKAYLGQGSLRLLVDLRPDDPERSGGAAWVDLRLHPPMGKPRLPVHDFAEAVVTVAIWVPHEAQGAPQAPNGIQLLFKDKAGRTKCSRWMAFADIPTDTWYQLAVDVAREAWSGEEADLAEVVAVGVRISTRGTPGAQGYTGPLWLDSFDWWTPSPPIRGFNYTAWERDAYATRDSDASLFRLAATGANYVGLLVTGYMGNRSATEIWADPVRTPSETALVQAIQTARRYGLRVMLKPHVDVLDGTWRGHLAPSDVEKWFQSYREFLVPYARLAQEQGVGLFCVGTELRSLSGAEFRPYWEETIAAVRAVYSGPLVYAANWDEYPRVAFWDLLDYVGIDAYFPLSSARTPAVEELLAAWGPWRATLGAWQGRIGKPVLFTEVGYRSVDHAAKEPWNWEIRGSYNPEAQANALAAVLQAFQGQPWFAGVFFWNWLPNPYAGGPGDTDYTPQNKPAEQVLARFFGERFYGLTDFEDGTPQGWQKASWTGPFFSDPAPSTQVAYEGRFSLSFPLRLDGRIEDAGSLVRAMNFSAYDAFVVHVFVPEEAPISWLGGVAFVKAGPEWTWHQGAWQNLSPGTWHTLTLELATVSRRDFVREAGFLVVGEGQGRTTLYIDRVGLLRRARPDTTPSLPPEDVGAHGIWGNRVLVRREAPFDPDFSPVRVHRSRFPGVLGEPIADVVIAGFFSDEAMEVRGIDDCTARSVELAGNESKNTDQYKGEVRPLSDLDLGQRVEAFSNEEPSRCYQREPWHIRDGHTTTHRSSVESDPQWTALDLMGYSPGGGGGRRALRGAIGADLGPVGRKEVVKGLRRTWEKSLEERNRALWGCSSTKEVWSVCGANGFWRC